MYQQIKCKKIKRINRIDAPICFAIPKSVNYFLGNMKDADFCIVNDTNRYSVHPDLVGKKATIRLYHDYLEIWIDNKLAARHVYSEGKYKRVVLPEHEAAYRGSSFQSELLKKAFLRLGESAKTYFV